MVNTNTNNFQAGLSKGLPLRRSVFVTDTFYVCMYIYIYICVIISYNINHSILQYSSLYCVSTYMYTYVYIYIYMTACRGAAPQPARNPRGQRTFWSRAMEGKKNHL